MIFLRCFFGCILGRFRFFLFHFSLILLCFEQFLALPCAYADLPIVVDGSGAVQVLQTASGVDQINIAAPNAAGVSHNRFSDYNINAAGQIINQWIPAFAGMTIKSTQK